MSFVEAIISHSSVHENEPCMLRRQSSTTFFKAAQTVNATRFRTEKFDDFYEKREEIGQGHFADVYRVIEKSTGAEYAAKYSFHVIYLFLSFTEGDHFGRQVLFIPPTTCVKNFLPKQFEF